MPATRTFEVPDSALLYVWLVIGRGRFEEENCFLALRAVYDEMPPVRLYVLRGN